MLYLYKLVDKINHGGLDEEEKTDQQDFTVQEIVWNVVEELVAAYGKSVTFYQYLEKQGKLIAFLTAKKEKVDHHEEMQALSKKRK